MEDWISMKCCGIWIGQQCSRGSWNWNSLTGTEPMFSLKWDWSVLDLGFEAYA